MKFYLYDRKEAIENKCYKSIIFYKKFIDLTLLCIKATLIIALGFLIAILGILIEVWALAYFGLFLLPILFVLVVIIIPIIYTNEFENCKIWLYRSIVKDINHKVLIVEQKNTTAYRDAYGYEINEQDIFSKILNKEVDGEIIELNNIKLIKETKKFYICSYEDQDKKYQTIKIAKAYKNLKEVL